MASFDDFESSAFKDRLDADSRGFTVGPYLACQVSPAWVVEASVGYGRAENENRLLILESEFTIERYTGSLTATGQYAVGPVNLRPKASLSYTYFRSESYELSGQLGRFPINLPRDKDTFDSGIAEVTVEVNRVFQNKRGTAFVPYLELGINYEFIRPDDGKILTGDLTTASTSAWAGSIRAGARTLVSSSFFIEASAGYLSLGQRDLNLWEGRLFLSYAF